MKPKAGRSGFPLRWRRLIPAFILLFFFLLFLQAEPASALVRKTLSNGLTLIIEKEETSAATAVCVLIGGGRRTEPPGKEGLAYLTARLCLEPPDSNYLHELMKLGSQVRVSSRGDFLLFSIESLSSVFEPTMKLLTRTLSRPLFSGIRVGNIRQMMKSSQEKEKDDPDSRAEVALLQSFFGSRGYGSSPYGSPSSVIGIKGDEAASFHKQYFVGSNMIVAIVTDLEEDKILEVIASTLGKLPSGNRLQGEIPSEVIPEQREINLTRESPSSYIAIAFPLAPLSPENFVLAHLLEHILGRGLESKIWSLRLEEQLAYEVGSRAILMSGGGVLQVYLKTHGEKATSAKERLLAKLKEIKEKGLSLEDLKMGQNSLKTSLYHAREIKTQRAEALAIYAGWGWPEDFESRVIAMIDAVSLEELSAYAAQVLDWEKAVSLVIAASGRGDEPGMKDLGRPSSPVP